MKADGYKIIAELATVAEICHQYSREIKENCVGQRQRQTEFICFQIFWKVIFAEFPLLKIVSGNFVPA